MNRLGMVLTILISMIMPTSIMAQPASTPEAENDQLSVSGNAFELLEEGEEDTVAIVAFSPPNERSDSIGAIVRNNTDGVVSDINVVAEIRDADGKLVAVADMSEFRIVNLYPGEVAVGLVLGSNINDPSLDITFKVTFEDGEDDSWLTKYDLEFLYTEWTGDRILGEFVNPSEETMDNIYLSHACFNDQGDLLGVEWGSAHGLLDPGETRAFQVGDYDPNMTNCTHHLVSGHGYPVAP